MDSKTQTLGMPHGTARNRLVLALLFSLVQEVGRDRCHVCGEVIKTEKELSIEHIAPWEGVSAELFFDLTNITFSHRKCNRPHVYRGGSHRKIISPEGMAWCSTCKKHLPIEYFSKNKGSWNGVGYYCKQCHKDYLSNRKQ